MANHRDRPDYMTSPKAYAELLLAECNGDRTLAGSEFIDWLKTAPHCPPNGWTVEVLMEIGGWNEGK